MGKLNGINSRHMVCHLALLGIIIDDKIMDYALLE